MNDSRVTPGALYRMVLLAFGLVVAGLVFRQLKTLVLAVLIVAVIALPLSAFATQLGRVGVPRAIGATLALLIGLGLIGGLIAITVPVFSQQVNQFVNSLPGITDSLRHRLAGLTGHLADQDRNPAPALRRRLHPASDQAARAARIDRGQRRRGAGGDRRRAAHGAVHSDPPRPAAQRDRADGAARTAL